MQGNGRRLGGRRAGADAGEPCGVDGAEPVAGSGATTPERVIEAAVECILAEGFYRASTNSIARRAGVTWGVIQHHFGTREALLLAVFEQAVARMDELFGAAEITGASVHERLEALADLVWSFYRQPQFLAYIQVALNLGQDPRTADRTLDALATLSRRMSAHLPRLREQVIGAREDGQDLFRFVFEMLRGAAVSQLILRALPNQAGADPLVHQTDRRTLVALLAHHVESWERSVSLPAGPA
jgi:TetR/AcrR family transcriptional regulator, regulator of cefoperazone and chloramphenicol sensitivity